VLLNLEEVKIQEEDLCKECTRKTLRQSVESMKPFEGPIKHKECTIDKVVSLHKLRRKSIEFPEGHQKLSKEAEGSRPLRD
jgi:hypothetical protein